MHALLAGGFVVPAFVLSPASWHVAQAQSSEGPATAVQHPGEHHHHDRPLPGQLIEARLAFIKTALKITDAQGAQWNAYADTLRKQAKEKDTRIQAMRAKHDAKSNQAGNEDLIERLEHHQKRMTDKAANLAQYIAVAKPFYASLSNEQKEVANQILAHHHRHHFHR